MAKLSVFIFIIALVIAPMNGAVIRRAPALSVTVESDKVFCSFLPPNPGGNIGESEDNATPFCTQGSPKAPGASIFPAGFILSAHFASTNTYVQVTGRMDPSKYNLSPNDGGGQYDNQGAGAPPGAMCTGYKKFVNLVEPSDGVYCIRCCTDADECDTGKSTEGCHTIIPGDYS